MTISGLVMKLMVSALPSLRRGKFLLKEVTMVLACPSGTVWRRHWPMHGPQALARDRSADGLQRCHLAVPVYGGADLLRPRRNQQRHTYRDTVSPAPAPPHPQRGTYLRRRSWYSSR